MGVVHSGSSCSLDPGIGEVPVDDGSLHVSCRLCAPIGGGMEPREIWDDTNAIRAQLIICFPDKVNSLVWCLPVW